MILIYTDEVNNAGDFYYVDLVQVLLPIETHHIALEVARLQCIIAGNGGLPPRGLRGVIYKLLLMVTMRYNVRVN